MSELATGQNNYALFHRHLFLTVSSLALVAYAGLTRPADAEQDERPTVWIELGGQMESTQGTTSPFVAPFMTKNEGTDPYKSVSFVDSQNQGRFAFGAEGKITLQPQDSDWKFSVGVRYGRSHASRHFHRQTKLDPIPWSFTYYGVVYPYLQSVLAAKVADSQTENAERHLVVDFSVGRDVGLGLFGRGGSSTIAAGLRFASFSSKSTAFMTGRPEINPNFQHVTFSSFIQFTKPFPTFHQYTMHASASRSFSGVGPSLSWDASVEIVGAPEAGSLTFDWGINGSLLFGRQKARTEQSTQAYHYLRSKYGNTYSQTYHNAPPKNVRSRSVAVPNLGGFAGFSVRYPNARVSFGYRGDYFFGAMDTGIDVRSTKDTGFRGPFATISIGLP